VAPIALAQLGHLDYAQRKQFPRGIRLTARSKASAGSLKGLPSIVQSGSQDENGVRLKYCSVLVEISLHFYPPTGSARAPAARLEMIRHPGFEQT
jgi:hypothetical protein